MAVDLHSDLITDTFIKQFNLVILTETSVDGNMHINEICRENGIGFISSESWGITGHIFVDFGDEFRVLDRDGNPSVQCVVRGITNSNPGIVSLDRFKKHGLGDG